MDSSHTNSPTSGPVNPHTSIKVSGLMKYAERHPAATTFFATYSTAFKAVTGAAFLAHFLRIRSAVEAQDAAVVSNAVSSAKKFNPIRRAGVAGLAWSAVWFGVLSATTLAEESVLRRVDPVAIQRKTRTPWNVQLADKEQI